MILADGSKAYVGQTVTRAPDVQISPDYWSYHLVEGEIVDIDIDDRLIVRFDKTDDPKHDGWSHYVSPNHIVSVDVNTGFKESDFSSLFN